MKYSKPEPTLLEPLSESFEKCPCGSLVFDSENICEGCGRRKNPLDRLEIDALGTVIASASHRGRRHIENQDSVGFIALPDGIAIAVADGVSSASHAKEASMIAIREALSTLQQLANLPPSVRIKQAVDNAHLAVCSLPNDDTSLSEPQATLVVALVEANQLWYAWAGDSRLYLFDQQREQSTLDNTEPMRLLTQDDSWLNEQLSRGICLQEALNDENAHCITQCLGMLDEPLQVHVKSCTLTTDVLLLMCSDGLWNYCDDSAQFSTLVQTQSKDRSLSECCVALVDFANKAGGHDNITVVLYRYSSLG